MIDNDLFRILVCGVGETKAVESSFWDLAILGQRPWREEDFFGGARKLKCSVLEE